MLNDNLKKLRDLTLRHHLPVTTNADDLDVLIAYYRDNDQERALRLI